MKVSKKLGFIMGLVSVAALASCADMSDPTERLTDEEVYAAYLSNFAQLHAAAAAEPDADKRLVKYAAAEAALLDSAVMNTTTTQGGNYSLSRVAPHTVPYSMWGNDDDRLGRAVLVEKNDTNAFITTEDRADLIAKWQAARAGTAAYDPKAVLAAKGYSFATKYKTTYSTAPATLDILNTSEQSDTEVLVNCIDGLVEYDNLGHLHGRLAVEQPNGLPYVISEDAEGNSIYTFTIRDDAKWVDADGNVIASVTGDDFVAGFQHMCDAAAGLEYLVEGVVKGAYEYIEKGGSWENVGVSASGQNFSIKLVGKESFFPTRLTYSCFMPMNRNFFTSHGGAFGIEAFKEAQASESYTYGVASDASNMCYNSAFRPSNIVQKSEIKLTQNASYYDKDSINFTEISWVYDAGENPKQTYDDAVAGTYVGVGLGEASGNLARAKEDGNFAKYHYIVDTTATTYLAGYNLNRGTWTTGSVVSPKTHGQKVDTMNAMLNTKFRKALIYGWDRKAFNAITVGEELAATSLRNSYTPPEFSALENAVTDGNKTFPQGSSYGSILQYYCDARGLGATVDRDGVDGWYNKDKAVALMSEAIEELKADGKWSGEVYLDVTYYGASAALTAQAEGYKSLIEGVFGEQGIHVNLNNAETAQDFYACGYRAADGKSGNYDVFYGSGWGPDYGDVSTYLDTFLGDGAGYMTKIIGIF